MAFISNGTTILDNGAFSVGLGGLVLLSEQTASASASISFTTGIDSTYPIYKFEFINIHPATNDTSFTFQVDTGTNTNYNQTITSTFFNAQHDESDTGTYLMYRTTGDQAQGTSFQRLTEGTGGDNDQSFSGTLKLFNPSSTTFVKHYLGTSQEYYQDNRSINTFYAGYCNVTVAIDGVQFSMSSGNIDSGTIKLYGIKDS